MSDTTPAISRERAWALLTSHTSGDSLLKHALAVEAAVRGYARRFGEDETFSDSAALRANERASAQETPLAAMTRKAADVPLPRRTRAQGVLPKSRFSHHRRHD